MVSIIIPSFNGADLLKRSLPVWLHQTFSEDQFEVLVVDNRSTDNTRAVVEGMIAGKPNFHYLYEDTPGATAARHTGVRGAKGDILLFADNDVLVNPDCLTELERVYRGNPECVAVTGRIQIQWDKDEPEWIAPYKYLLGELNYGDETLYGHDFYLNGGFLSVRRNIFERLHGFNPDLIGAHLIGDGDTGFVKKLFKEHLLIGFTPRIIIQHLQQVDKHGSEKGVALHFYNNGIADSYAAYRGAGFRLSPKILGYIVKEFAILLKQWIGSRILHRNSRHKYFAMRQHAGRVHFFTLLLKPELRKQIQVKDVYNA